MTWEEYKRKNGVQTAQGTERQGQSGTAGSWTQYKQTHDVTQNRDLRTERQKYQDPDYLRYKESLKQIDQQAAQMTDRRVLNEMRAGLTIEKPNDYMKAEAAYAQRSNRAEQDMTLAAERYAAAKQYGDRFSTGRYAGDWNKAYNQQLRAGDKLAADYQSIYNADMDRLKQENPGIYYGTTMSGDDLTQRIEAMKANLEKLDAQRAELSRQQNEQTNRNPEYDYGKGSSVSSEEDIRALADRRNTNIQRIGDMIAGLDKRREELQRQIDEYDVGLKYQAQQRGEAIEKEYLEDGRLNTPEVREMAALGQKRYEADRTRALQGASAELGSMVQEQVAQGRQIGGMTRFEFLKAQEDQGVDVTLDLAANLRPEDAQVFFALYAGDPEKAKEWIKYISLKRDREYQQSVAEQAKSQGWLGTVPNFVGGTTARMISGVLNVADPYGPAATQYARYSQGLLQGGGEFLNEKLPEIPENVPIIGGKGAGDVYQLLSSVAESQTVAAIAAASGNYAGAISALGVMLMGSSAAVSDYNDSVQNGLTREQATQHALAAGIAEAAFEYLSIENLVNWSDFSNTLTSRIKLWLTQGGVEASEEFFTTIANRISDGVLARKNGYDTSVEQRMKELMALGVDRDEARKTAEEEWVTELLNDAIGGFVSGNLSSGVQMITDFGLSRYRDVRDSRQYQNALEQRGADITTAEEAQALQSFAQANGIQVDDNLISGVEARSQTEAKQEELAGKSTLEQQAEKISEDKQTRSERKQEQKSNRSLGTLQQQTVSRIAENVRRAGLANAQTVYDEQVGKHGGGISRSVQAAVTRVAADQFGAATTQETLNAKYNQAIQGVTAQPVREAIQSAYNAKTVELARGGDQSAFGRLVQQYGNSKGNLNLDVQVNGENGTEQTAQIVGVTNNAESVKLSNGQTVKVSELAGIDADTKDVLDRIAYMEVGAAAGNMWQAFQIGAEKRTTADNYRWIMDYTTAFDQGRVGKLSLNEAISRSSLDSDIVRMAYELGQQAAKEQTAADKRKLDEKRKAVKPGATGKKGILDASAISEKTMKGLSRQHKQQLQIIEKIAEALGVDVVLYDSTVKDGKYQGANGYYDPKTGQIHLDINAGRNSIRDIGSGILAVTGHELTHWMQEYAPEQYAAYRDAVVKALVSTEGETGFEYLVDKARRDSSKKLTRTQAIDEVVADASMQRVGDEDFWNAMADSLGEEKQGVVAKIRQFFSEWFAKIREALAGSPHMSEAARAVDRAEAQVQKALGKLYAEGISEAARTAREIGADATALGASDQMLQSEGVKIEEKNADRKFSSRSTDEAYMEAVNSGDMETAQRMVDETARKAGYKYKAYHGTAANFTIFDKEKIGSTYESDEEGFFFTTNKEEAELAAGDAQLKTGEDDKILSVYLKIEDPLIINTKEKSGTDYFDAWKFSLLDRMHGYNSDGIIINGTKSTTYVVLDSEQVKFAAPVTYDDKGDPIPLSERFNSKNEDIRYSERDYSQKTDLELMAEAAETLSEAGGEEYWQALLNSVPELAENEGGVKSRMQEIKRLAQKLSETEKKLDAAKADMKPTDRKLNTSGISAMVKDAMKSFEITDAKKNGIVQKATQALIDGYQQALDAIDAGKSDQIPDITYNAAVKAAEILLTEGRHTENHGGKWSNTTAERYLGEDRQQLIDHMVAAVGADFALNRYRKAIRQTTADRLISRTKNEMQKKLDAQKEKGEALTAENAKLTNENEWLKAAADTAKEQVGSLNDQLQYLKEKMQDAGKLSTKEKAKLRQQARNLNKRLQAAKEEAKAWRTRAEQEGKLATQYGEKQAALIKKLEDQKAREQAILEGKLKPLPMQRMLKAVREAEAEKVKQHKDEVFSRYKENQRQAQLRSRIRNLSDEMKRTMTKPTDGSYVPAALYGSMTKLADALDSLLAPNDGTKAAARYRAVMDQIHALSAEYRAVQSMDDPVYSSEYDEEIQFEIDEIVKILQGANSDEVGTLNMTPAKIRELNTEELQKVYNILKYINWSMKTAKDMMSSGQFRSVYDAMTSIVEQQRALRSAAGMGLLGRTKRSRMLDSLNVMRAVEMMSNWDRSAALYQIMHQVEQGVVKSDAWTMDYNKSLQELKTGKNEKAYRDALTKKLDYSVTDEEGLPVKMTKMQAIQILMTAEREAGNDKLVHLQKGGAVIRDALKIQDGKTDKAGGQTIQVTPELLQRIQDSLTEWDRAYMKAVRAYLAKEGKATNQVMYALKHRVLETEPNYVPYIVDKNYLDTDLNEKQAMNMWVKTPGSTNALKQKASQPVIIDGMDTVMAKHVKEIADYIGMALPIRDFSKVYNGKLKQGEGENPLPVKKLIDRNWEKKGLHLLTQSIIDVQGGSRSNSWSTAIAEHLNALQSAFVKSALLINPSVTIKQAASYAAAGSILSHRALDRANHPISVKTDESNAFDPATGLIGHIFIAPNGKTATRIYNEIDKYTSMHYLRRQGMSQYELANEANRNGPVRRRVNAAGARMEQNIFGHAARKVGASLNPVSWIQRMDVATTATLWLACKEQARMDGLTVNSQEYWQRTTELYERVLRETQPMYDSLHRNAFQKGQGLFQYLFPFRTVPIQNHGQLAAAVETWMASKNKSTAEKKEAAKFLRKTAFAQTESAIVFSLMTFIAAALKRKTKKYRDEDEELGLGSVIKGIGTDTAGTLFSVLMPVAGSELWNIGSRLAGKFDGSSGYTYDAFSVGVVDLLNDLAGSFDKISEDLGKLHRGEDASEFWSHGLTMLLKAAKLANIPADTIKTYWEGIRGNVEDALNGRLPALNDESWERSAAVNAERYVKALEAGDSEKVDQVEAEMLQDYADAGKSEDEAEKALKTKLTSTLKEKYEGGSIEAQDAVDLLVETGFYDENDAWKKVKEWEVKAEHKGETDYHYSQYDELYAAMDQNGDVSGIVKDLTDHGVDPDSVKSAAKRHLIDRYMAGEINSNQIKNQLSRYCGIVGTDATNLVRWLDLRKAKPGLEVTQAQCNAWYDGSKKTQENGHESAKAAGMSIEAYLEAKAVLDEIKDSNDNGTGEDEVIEALAKMKLTPRQKDALYYERYKGTTKYSVKKW